MNKLTLPPFIPVLPALYYVAVIRVGWKRLAGVINIYHFIENKHNPPVYPQPQKEQWAVSGEQRQPLPFVIPLTPRLLRGLRACLALPTPCVPPQLGQWVQASGHCQRAGGRASPMETPQHGATSSLGNGMEMGAMGAALRTPHSQPQRPPRAQTQPKPMGRGRILPWCWAKCRRSQPILTARGDGAGGSLQPFVSGRGINYFVLSLRWNKTHFRVA